MKNPAYLLLNLAKNLKYQLNDALKTIDLTASQWAILQQLALHENQTANQIGTQLDMDKPTISGILKRLEDKGYLIKKKHPKDARAQLLSLTESGLSQYHQAKTISKQVLANFLNVLSVNQQADLTQLLSILNGANNHDHH